jgi:hypothetical protein
MFQSARLRRWTQQPTRRQNQEPFHTIRPRLEELEPRRLLTLLPAPTTSTIGVIEDQLALLAPSAEVTFAATHADGTQKQTSNLNQLYTSINPNWYLLHYQLGTGQSHFLYIINNAWTQDFDPALPNFVNNPPAGPGGVTSHEDWFEHSDGSLDPSTTGNRLVNNEALYMMNIDSPGWRNYQTTTLVQNMVATGAQGVFADSFGGPTFGYFIHQGDKRYDYGGPIPGPADPSLWPNGETWLQKAANYISYIQGQLTAAGEALYGPGGGFAYVPNGGSLNTGWADIDYSASKGLFAEAFAVSGQPITGGDWNLSMDRALRITTTSDPGNADRLFIMQPYPWATPDSAEGLRQRGWALGSYLLLKGDHTYINMLGAPTSSGLEWYPEYQVNLGAPQDPGGMPTTVAGYYDPASGLYRRFFEHGIVLVNNTDTTQVYDPGQTMQQVIVNGWGGGVRNGDIDPATNSYVAGWLSSQLVSTVAVAPFSSVILINAGDPIDAPPGGGGVGSGMLAAPLGSPSLPSSDLPGGGDPGAASAASLVAFLEPAAVPGATLSPARGPDHRDAPILPSSIPGSDSAIPKEEEPLSGGPAHIITPGTGSVVWAVDDLAPLLNAVVRSPLY